ncbi:hypothetical protein Glittering_2 [Bacillus phage Glittering]|uniref:Uncharacterized protein n=1 Tax=Bacillus phage Glittering TaxID=2884421 RepID=U5PTI0_9CAUD|nr:hypothetical protein Glittering_2 [Bacillus phage Glittering]AGY47189.1 hypothetical protein Glittering_2 [Bacillus phage Glittering]
MHKPSELADYLNHAIYEHYGHTSLRVKLNDTSEDSTYYSFFLADPALNCDWHPMNIRDEVLELVRQRASTLVGIEAKVIQKGVLIYHPRGVH